MCSHFRGSHCSEICIQRRENELLRQQLKKYVETVQVMRRSDAAGGEQQQEAAGAARSGNDNESGVVRDYSLEVEQYERKLVQVSRTSFTYTV